MTAFAFDGITVPAIAAKPRACGITSVLDKGLGPRRVDDLLETAGGWIDVVKFGWATARLQPLETLQAKLAAYRQAGVATCTGGTFLELAAAQDRVEYFILEARAIGFTMVEVSNGVSEMTAAEKAGLIRRVRDAGLGVWSEVGKKEPEEDAKISDQDRLAAVERELDAGAEKVILEARESGSIGIFDRQGKPHSELLFRLVDRFGLETLIFEAPRKDQQVWMIRNFGSDVNLGNVAAEDALSLATLRTGLRGDTFALWHDAGRRESTYSGRKTAPIG